MLNLDLLENCPENFVNSAAKYIAYFYDNTCAETVPVGEKSIGVLIDYFKQGNQWNKKMPYPLEHLTLYEYCFKVYIFLCDEACHIKKQNLVIEHPDKFVRFIEYFVKHSAEKYQSCLICKTISEYDLLLRISEDLLDALTQSLK